MEPVLFSFHAPVHELDLVGRQVVREGLAARMREWRQGAGASELVYLATCQRVMWMFWGGDPGRLKSLESAVRFEGDAARGHLLALSAGLESANLGDREIPDQMRDALAQAREVGTAGEEAHASLEDAIREGQRLRARLGMADGSISVATAALRHLTDALPEGASIAVVGVGPMSHYLAARLPERGFRVTLSNRTLPKAEELAAELGISQVISLSHLQRNPDGFDALVTATASPVPLFTLEAWGGLSKRAPLRILDLAHPLVMLGAVPLRHGPGPARRSRAEGGTHPRGRDLAPPPPRGDAREEAGAARRAGPSQRSLEQPGTRSPGRLVEPFG